MASRRGPRPPSTDMRASFSPTPPRTRKGGPRPPPSPPSGKVRVKRQVSEILEEEDWRNWYDESDPPTKENGYHAKRMSTILRVGVDPKLDLDKILWKDKDEHEELEQEEAVGFREKIEHAYKVKVTEKKVGPRALICATAVALLWATSLTACRTIINVIIRAPVLDDVVNDTFGYFDEIEDQKVGYAFCVEQEVNTCRNQFDEQKFVELNRVQELQGINNEALALYESIRNTCKNEYEQALDFAALFMNNGATDSVTLENNRPAPIPNSCPDNLNAVMQQQAAANAAVTVASDTADASQTAVTDANTAVEERLEYDINYFSGLLPDGFSASSDALNENLFSGSDLSESMAESLAELTACLDGSVGGEECPNTTSVADQIDQMLNKYEQMYSDLESQADQFIIEVEAGIAQAEQIMAIIDGIPGFNIDIPPFNLLTDFLPDIEGLTFDDFFDEFGIDLDVLDNVTAEIQAQLDAELAAHAEALDAIAEDIQKQQEEFEDALTGDYDPPPVDQSALTSVNESGDILAQQIADDLGAIDDEEVELPSIENITSFANETATQLVNGLVNRDFNPFSYGPEVFDALFFGLTDLFDWAVKLDIIWRVLQSLLLVKKYWNISGINTPPADVRAEGSKLFKAKSNKLQKMAKLLSSPGVQMLFTTLWIGLLTLLVYFAYEPLFSSYVEGCVDTQATDFYLAFDGTLVSTSPSSEGTMIFRNLFSVARGIALSDGDVAISTEVDTLNVERSAWCAEQFENSVFTRNRQTDTFTELAKDQTFLVSEYDTYEKCVDWVSYDGQVDSANNKAEILGDLAPTYSFNEVFTVERTSCHQEFAPIDLSDDLLYECVSVDPCQSDCDPTNEGTVLARSFEAACEIERTIHSYFLIGLFSSAMYICVNLSRFYIMRGIIAVRWKSISLDLFSYLGSCTEKGRILPPEDVEDGDMMFREAIDVALVKALRAFEIKGYFDLGYAVLINLPWVVFVTILSRDLSFEA